jgi:hypothetical protein
LNNPLRYVDPDGHQGKDAENNGKELPRIKRKELLKGLRFTQGIRSTMTVG